MKNLLTLCFLMAFSLGFSQDLPSSFSLQEAIDYALENNRQAVNATRDIAAAQKQKWITTTTGLPQLNATVNYQNFLKQQVSVIPAEFFGGNPGEFQEVVFGTKQNATATATLNQLIFDGSYVVALQASKVFLEISENAKVKTDLEVRKMVINAYGNVLLSEESVRILERNVDVLQKNLNDITKIFENGLEEEESVEQLQITLSNIKSSLNNAERLKKLAYQMLNVTLGIDFNANIKLTDDLETLALKHISLNTLSETNDVTTTIDYKIAANDTKSKELMVKLEKSKALPSLGAFINGGYNSFSDDFVFFDNNNRWFGFSSVGLNLNVPIFSSGKRSASTQLAEINLEKSQTDLNEVQQRLNLEIEAAESNYRFAVEDYDNKKQNLALAERIERKNQTKFFEGIGSSFELRQAQIQLFSAQQELLQTMLDVINSKTALETITNKTSQF